MEIKTLFTILIATVFINNYVLSQILGLCPFLGVSKKIDSAIGMGLAVIFVMGMASFFTFFIYKYILVPYQITSCAQSRSSWSSQAWCNWSRW
jgi:electron transport complex protein RnfA